MADKDKPGEFNPIDETEELEEDEFNPFRDVPVGTNDPNIVGHVGAFDKPPGQNPVDEDDMEVSEDDASSES